MDFHATQPTLRRRAKAEARSAKGEGPRAKGQGRQGHSLHSYIQLESSRLESSSRVVEYTHVPKYMNDASTGLRESMILTNYK